jgi:hypothetical protein
LPVGETIGRFFSRWVLDFVQKLSFCHDTSFRSTMKQDFDKSDFLIISESLRTTGSVNSSLFVLADKTADLFPFPTLI